jgi:nucleoside-diphosphate-sugar epimerase
VWARRELAGRADRTSGIGGTGRTSGPYAWGKAESERVARSLGDRLGVQVRIVRPGAIVDGRCFDPPGKLGRRVGNVFVAIGRRSDALGTVDLRDAARLLAWMALSFDEAPEVLNLVDPDLPSKAQLVRQLRGEIPGLRVIWLPRAILRPLSWAVVLAQKMVRPGQPVLDLAAILSAREYDTRAVRSVWKRARGGPEPSPRVVA